MKTEELDKKATIAEAIDIMSDAEGFVFMAVVNGETKIIKYDLSVADIVSLFEQAKFALMMDAFKNSKH